MGSSGSHGNPGHAGGDHSGAGADHVHVDHEHGHVSLESEPHSHSHEGGHHHDDSQGIVGWVKALYRPHSHDAADSIDTALESSAQGIKAVKISLVGLMVTAVLQVLIVVLTGSVALLADTIHNFSDALTSIPLWIAFVLGRRAANKTYTYGYRRAEDLSGLFIVLMIAFSAVLAGWESVERLANPRAINNIGLVIAAGIVGFIGNEIVAIYRIRVGTRIGSAALIADGHHARTDGLTSLAVVAGAVGVALGYPSADPIVGLLITIAILFVLRDAARQVFKRLMDAVDPALVALVERQSTSVAGVNGVKDIRVRWVGHRLDASLIIVVDTDMSVGEGHEIAQLVTEQLFRTIPKLVDVMIHVDPDGIEHEHSLATDQRRLAGTSDSTPT